MNTILLIVVGMAALGGLGVAIFYGVRWATAGGGGGDIHSRLEEYGSRPDGSAMTLEELEMAQPFSQRVIRPLLINIAEAFSKLSPSKSREAAELKLELAGRPNGWGAKEFFGVRVFVAAVLGVLLFLIGMVSDPIGLGALTGIAFGLVGALIGFVFPILWLGSKIKARQKEIIKSLPDALDLLTITVEAGMGFDGAIQKVAEKWENELSKGFSKVVQEMRLGVPRREALKNMERTMDVSDVTTFVAAIIQAEQLGVSIAKILRVQSEQMRMKRRQRAEAEANKAPIKMLFPMVFLIFPALFIILLGPAVLIIMETNFG